MGIGDKASNKGEDLGGKAKEAPGRATGDRDLEAEGKGDQASASVKDAGEKVKDAGKDLKDGLTKSSSGRGRSAARLPAGIAVGPARCRTLGTGCPPRLASGRRASPVRRPDRAPPSWRLRFSSSVADGTSVVRHTTRE